MNLVIVESPAKAKTINKFLGNDYIVKASYGHVRDINNKKGIDVENNFAINYEEVERQNKYINEIKKSIKACKKLYLATDQDREGEAIAWHIVNILEKYNKLASIEIFRITFNEITKDAILNSIKSPRSIDMNLVNAYQARRSLDYLMGYSLSPLLIRKFPGCKSAGRVQSVALKLISERENEIQKFISQEYWSINVDFETSEKHKIESNLQIFNSSKLKKLDIHSEKYADEILEKIKISEFLINDIEKKQKKLNPSPPFITSTLQLEASNKLSFSPGTTMSLAQKLYEGIDVNGENKGLITYIRTDSTNLSTEFTSKAREIIKNKFGDSFVSDTIRNFKNKVKNAQEAHEAIRPSDPSILPKNLAKSLEPDLLKLYELIWNRSIATQASQAITETVTIKICSKQKDIVLSSSFSKIKFKGFKVFYDTNNNNDINEKEINENISSNSLIKLVNSKKKQHFTEPPPRYSEASLIKKMEEFGIGRPSTYANIMKKNQERGYVSLKSKRFFPQPSGRIVASFLDNYFNKYMNYNFTAEKEDELDLIANGSKHWKDALNEFWGDFNEKVQNTLKLSNSEVYDYVNDNMKDYLFPAKKENENSRVCPKCKTSTLSIKMRKNGTGPFVACTSHPECDYIRSQVFPTDDQPEELVEDKILGTNEEGTPIILKKGPYGPYVQLGNDIKDKKKIKRSSIPKNTDLSDVTIEYATKLLSLPREVGPHPETGATIFANYGRYGPYLQYNKEFYSIPKGEDPLSIGINRAVDILSQPKKRRSTSRSSAIKSLGVYEKLKSRIELFKGKFGFYIKCNDKNYSLPKNYENPESLTLKDAIAVIEKKTKS